MTIEALIKLQPFRVPNFVLTDPKIGKREDGFYEKPKYALNELDAATLDLLCEQFREDVFRKAGKMDTKAR